MQTIQQERAKYALEQVQAAAKSSEFLSYASAMPAMIVMNGLGQTAAFYRSKGTEKNAKGKAYLELYKLLSDWLKKEGNPYEEKELLEGITQCNMQSYLLAQAEALALLDWVKKFAKAYMKE